MVLKYAAKALSVNSSVKATDNCFFISFDISKFMFIFVITCLPPFPLEQGA